jgi:branched-chain amino acid aminotransferase
LTIVGSQTEIAIHRTASPVTAAERARLLEAPGFGEVFTDHMVTGSWSQDRGWQDFQLRPFGPLSLHPAASILHYGQQVFEGLKAYRQVSRSIVTFRPEAHAARFNRSAARLAMPALPEDTFVRAIDALVSQDHQWVPSAPDHSLYLRPVIFATYPDLKTFSKPSPACLFMLIASPSAGYFAGPARPVSVWLCRDYSRAAPGGTGAAKTGGNYGGSLAGQLQATQNGCDQVVWLDACEHRWVEEMGGMNLFFVYGSGDSARIMTPALTGSLLPGITRETLLTAANDLGIPAEEGSISVDQWRAGCRSGEITEAFACGTAAMIAPIGTVKAPDDSWTVGSGEAGPVGLRLRDHLLGIQFGRVSDRHGWTHQVVLGDA